MAENPHRDELWATCRPCNHTWLVVYLPMDVMKLCKAMKAAYCPKCGEKKKNQIFMATEAEIVAALNQPKPEVKS